jgi:hypothetical protein
VTQILIDLKGTSPLAQRNQRLADPLDDFTRRIKELTSKRKKTDADQREIEHLEFLGGLYFDPSIGIYVRTIAIKRCFERAATITRQGTAVNRALALFTDKTPLVYEGPRDPQQLWERQEFRWRELVRNEGPGGGRVIRMRPIFRAWSLSVQAELVDEALNLDDFDRIVQTAGRVEGLLEGRQIGNGRFTATVVAERGASDNGRVPSQAGTSGEEARGGQPVRA